MKTPEQLIDMAKLCEATGLPPWTLYRYVREKKLPHYRLGRRVLFNLEEIKAALKVEVRP